MSGVKDGLTIVAKLERDGGDVYETSVDGVSTS